MKPETDWPVVQRPNGVSMRRTRQDIITDMEAELGSKLVFFETLQQVVEQQEELAVQVREAENILLIKGAIPGANGDYVIIRESKKNPKKAAVAPFN